MNYQFPRSKFVDTNTLQQQATQILSEAVEFSKAIVGGSFFEECDEEAMDMLHAIETYFWKREKDRGPGYVEDIRQAVFRKNRDRGYY